MRVNPIRIFLPSCCITYSIRRRYLLFLVQKVYLDEHCIIRVAMERKAPTACFKGKYEIEMFMMKCFLLLPSFDIHLRLEYSSSSSSQKRLVNELRTFMLLLFAQKNSSRIHRPPRSKRRTFSLSSIFRPQKQKMELSFDTTHLFGHQKSDQ